MIAETVIATFNEIFFFAIIVLSFILTVSIYQTSLIRPKTAAISKQPFSQDERLYLACEAKNKAEGFEFLCQYRIDVKKR